MSRPLTGPRPSPHGFQCPLRHSCFSGSRPYSSFHAANRAVSRYLACRPSARDRQAERLYLRHLPLVRKTLARFCRTSRCYPGSCVVEDLIGESYLAFRHALDRFDPTYGVDFVGYVSQRLFWALEHQVRRLRAQNTPAVDPQEMVSADDEERIALQRIAALDVLERLDPADAELLTQSAAGYSDRELAATAGVKPATLRKRLERARHRARDEFRTDDTISDGVSP